MFQEFYGEQYRGVTGIRRGTLLLYPKTALSRITAPL
jgi:hypothetical protein